MATVAQQAWSMATDMRMMFYGVGPEEMSQNVERGTAPAFMVKAIPYFLLMIACECAVGVAKGRPVYRLNDAVVSLLSGSTQMIWSFWLKLLGISAYCWVYDNLRVADVAPASWGGWLGCLLLVDCSYYWMHRHAHTFHMLWSAHSVHHSGEDYNLATALRQGAMQPFYSWLWKMPNAFFFHPLIFAHHSALNTLYQFWIHTTLVGDLGPLEYVLNTPSHHRMHHRPPGNCNYAGVLIVWDRMFGTFVGETEQRDYYGLVKQYDTFDPIHANAEHLLRMRANVDPDAPRNLAYFAGLLFKRRVRHRAVFRPMALFEPLPRRTASLWAKPQPNKRERYDGLPSAKHPALRAYVLCLFVAAVALTVAALESAQIIRKAEAPLVQFICFVTYLSLGRLLDGFERGHRANTARVLAFLCISSLLVALPVDDPAKKRAASAFHAFCLVDIVAWFAVYGYLSRRAVGISQAGAADDRKTK